MEPALPLKSVVLFIAVGTTAFIIVFIFAKRQITRFALKSHGPHVAIGLDAPKDLKQEIERRLHRVGDIQFEPVLLSSSLQGDVKSGQDQLHFFYRMKAIDSLALLDAALQEYSPHIRRRLGQHTLRSFLLEQRHSGPLEGCQIEIIEKFTEAYVHARHDPLEFLEVQYKEFMDLLNQLIAYINEKKGQKGYKRKSSSQNCSKEAMPSEQSTSIASDDKDGKNSKSTVNNGGPVKGKEVQVTYRPNGLNSSAGILQMAPATTGSSGSSQADAVSLEGPSNPNSARSSRSSGHFETPV